MEESHNRKRSRNCFIRAPNGREEQAVVSSSNFTTAKHPMQEITVDYIRYIGRVFIIMVDGFLRCVFCKEAEDEAIESTIKIMETWFGHFGYPERVRAGIGPTFCSNFTSWLRKEETDMETDPASNSLDYRLMERAMWKCKEIIKKGWRKKTIGEQKSKG